MAQLKNFDPWAPQGEVRALKQQQEEATAQLWTAISVIHTEIKAIKHFKEVLFAEIAYIKLPWWKKLLLKWGWIRG